MFRINVVAGDVGLVKDLLLSTLFRTYSNEIEALPKPVVIADTITLPTVARDAFSTLSIT